MERKCFNKGLALMMAAFPEYKGMAGNEGKATIEVYWKYLKDFHDNDFAVVVSQVIKTKKYFPKISELREELVHLTALRDQPTAAEEWGQILKAAEAGKDNPGELTPAAEKALAVVGGFDRFKVSTYDSLQFAFNKFEKAFNEGADKQAARQRSGGAENLLSGGRGPAQIEATVKGLLEEGKK